MTNKSKTLDYASNLLLVANVDNLRQWKDTFAGCVSACINRGGTTYICGNGGSAANAMHIANDYTYAYGHDAARLSIEAITSNSAILTCLANDIGYEHIFSYQLERKMKAEDLLIVLSGSGNSKNVIEAVNVAKKKDCEVLSIVGFDGGAVKQITDKCIHIGVDDMQVAEDLQVIIAHSAMRQLIERP